MILIYLGIITTSIFTLTPEITKSCLNISMDLPKGASVVSVKEGPFHYNRVNFENEGIATISYRFPSTFPETPLKGVVLLCHGCTHNGDDWFRLCEDRQIVEFLLNNNYAAVGLNSIAGRDGCWINKWPVSENLDAERVTKALDIFFTAFKLNISSQRGSLPDCSQIPVFMLGGSSGGIFVSIFPYLYPVNGIIVHISPGHESAFKDAEKEKYPPTAFIFMSGDMQWASKENINYAKQVLVSKSIPSSVFKIDPFPLSVDKICQLLDVQLLSKKTITVLFRKLRKAGYIKENGKLKKDPRQTDILEDSMLIIEKEGHINDEELLSDNLVELYNSAWGVHEMSHVHFEDALAFLVSEHVKRCSK